MPKDEVIAASGAAYDAALKLEQAKLKVERAREALAKAQEALDAATIEAQSAERAARGVRDRVITEETRGKAIAMAEADPVAEVRR